MKEEEWVEGKEKGEDNWRIDEIPSKISMKPQEGDRMVRRWEEIRLCEGVSIEWSLIFSQSIINPSYRIPFQPCVVGLKWMHPFSLFFFLAPTQLRYMNWIWLPWVSFLLRLLLSSQRLNWRQSFFSYHTRFGTNESYPSRLQRPITREGAETLWRRDISLLKGQFRGRFLGRSINVSTRRSIVLHRREGGSEQTRDRGELWADEETKWFPVTRNLERKREERRQTSTTKSGNPLLFVVLMASRRISTLRVLRRRARSSIRGRNSTVPRCLFLYFIRIEAYRELISSRFSFRIWVRPASPSSQWETASFRICTNR